MPQSLQNTGQDIPESIHIEVCWWITFEHTRYAQMQWEQLEYMFRKRRKWDQMRLAAMIEFMMGCCGKIALCPVVNRLHLHLLSPRART